MSIGNKGSLDKASLKPEKLKQVSSPARIASSKADKPSAVEAVATADATDPAETQALVNELKAKMNEMLAALQK